MSNMGIYVIEFFAEGNPVPWETHPDRFEDYNEACIEAERHMNSLPWAKRYNVRMTRDDEDQVSTPTPPPPPKAAPRLPMPRRELPKPAPAFLTHEAEPVVAPERVMRMEFLMSDHKLHAVFYMIRQSVTGIGYKQLCKRLDGNCEKQLNKLQMMGVVQSFVHKDGETRYFT